MSKKTITPKTHAAASEAAVVAEAEQSVFLHTTRAPSRGDGWASYQCHFGAERNVVSKFVEGGWMEAGVYRDCNTDNSQLVIITNALGFGRNEINLNLTADDLQALACAMLDAAHHLRTAPAAKFVKPVVKADAEAVHS